MLDQVAQELEQTSLTRAMEVAVVYRMQNTKLIYQQTSIWWPIIWHRHRTVTKIRTNKWLRTTG